MRVQQFRRLNSVAPMLTMSILFRRLNTGLERPAGKPEGTSAAVFRRLNSVDAQEAAVVQVRPCPRVRSLMSSLLFRRLNSSAELLTAPTVFRRLNTVQAGGVTDLSLFRRLNSCITLLKRSYLSLGFIHPYAQARTARCSWHVHTHGTGPLHYLNPAKCGVQCFWAPKGKHMR